ncbi:MAG: hypothetical protein IT328_05975 [Caldilineaceae bacterium]|nr:hypothetical protein [Caldilineaceae bacterium]
MVILLLLGGYCRGVCVWPRLGKILLVYCVDVLLHGDGFGKPVRTSGLVCAALAAAPDLAAGREEWRAAARAAEPGEKFNRLYSVGGMGSGHWLLVLVGYAALRIVFDGQ